MDVYDNYVCQGNYVLNYVSQNERKVMLRVGNLITAQNI